MQIEVMWKMKKKIVFGITSLTLGGAEKVLVDIVNELKDDYDITIFTLYAKGEFETQLDSQIKLHSLYPKRYHEISKIKKILISLQLLLFGKSVYQKKVKEDYDIEIAFLEGPMTRLFRFKNPSAKKIAWIHNDITKVFGQTRYSRLKTKYDEKIYQSYNHLIFVSQDNQENFKKQYPKIDENKMQVIHNYINAENVIQKAQEPIELNLDENIFNVGVVARYTKQKALDRLIQVHTKLKEDGYKERIYAIGDGPQREALENLIKENKVEDSFILLGKKENPYPYMKQMDVIALLSHYEGYGMVLDEAKILNKNIIITDTAAREALKDTKNGKIVENSEEGIYQGLKEMIIRKNENTFDVVKEEYESKQKIEQIKEMLEQK